MALPGELIAPRWLPSLRPHLRPVTDVFGSVRIVQGADGLLNALNTGSNGGNDAGLCLATKRVTQETGQL